MTGHIRRCSDQSVLIDLADLHHIVRNKTMSASDQFERSLAFTDSAVTGDHQTLTIDIDQYAVNADARRQLLTKRIDQLRGKFGSRSSGTEYRYMVRQCLLQKDRIRRQISRKNNTRNIKLKERIITDLFLFIAHLLDICILYISDNLDTRLLEMLKISGKLQRRTVNIGRCNLTLF